MPLKEWIIPGDERGKRRKRESLCCHFWPVLYCVVGGARIASWILRAAASTHYSTHMCTFQLSVALGLRPILSHHLPDCLLSSGGPMNSRETWKRTLRGETGSFFTQAAQSPALRLLSQVIWLQGNTDISFRGWVQLLKSGPNVNFLKLDPGSCEGCPGGLQQPESTECPESGFLSLFFRVLRLVWGRRDGLFFTPRLGGSIGCCTQVMLSLN